MSRKKVGCLGLLGLLIVIVTIMVVALATSPPEPQVVVTTGNQTKAAELVTTSAPLPSVGQAARKGNWQVTFQAQEKAPELRGGFSAVNAQGEFRILTLTLANVGKRSYALNSHDFLLVTPDGVEYSLASEVGVSAFGEESGPPVFWLIETIQPGLSKDVRVVFDVPPGVTGFVLKVQDVRFAVPD